MQLYFQQYWGNDIVIQFVVLYQIYFSGLCTSQMADRKLPVGFHSTTCSQLKLP